MEQEILGNSIASRKCYDAVRATGHHENLSDRGKAIWKLLDKWYAQDGGATSVNDVLLIRMAEQAYPAHADEFREYIKDLRDHVSGGNFREVLLEGRRQVLRELMAVKLMERRDEEYSELHSEFNTLFWDEDAEQHDYIGTDPAALVEAVEEGVRIPLAPDVLNANIRGGMLPGHHAVIFGRPEAGKSLFAINSLVRAAQAGYKVGYWENEDPIVATQLRVAQCCANATESEVKAGGRRITKALEKAGWYDRIFFRDSPAGTLPEIERWVKQNKLDFLVVNQMRNVHTKERDNRVLELESISKGLREIAKVTNTAVMSVTQAGDSGDGRRILRMGDLDWSNTGIQAACDLLIGFGTDEELELTHNRMLSLCKNKLGNNHDAILIRIDTERNYID